MHISYSILTLFLGCGEEENQKTTFKNLPPFSPIVEIIPEKDGQEVAEADTTTDLRVKLYPEEVLPEDPNGDTVTIRYVWLVDGELSGIEGDLIVAADTVKGQTWQVYAYANDGSLDSAPAIREVTIQNARPKVLDVSSSPENPTTTDDLTVEVNSTSDDDGDEVTVSYAWLKNGETQGDYSDNVLPFSATSKGEQWIVQITPHDGITSGNPVEEVFTIANTLPTITTVTLPENSTKENGILVTIEAEDADEDELTYSYAWFVNNNEIADAETEVLDTAYFKKGDTVHIAITANDGDGDSDSVSSSPIVVQNTPPVLTSVTISDSTTVGTEIFSRDNTVVCSVETSDIDEIDVLETTYSWSLNGVEIATGSELIIATTSIQKDDVLVCTAVTNDGTDDSESMDTSVTITNAMITLSNVSLPTEARYIDTVQASYSTTDEDGDAAVTFMWYNGTDVSSATELPVSAQSIDLETLASDGHISIGDTIFVVITLSDEDTTITETSGTLLITDVDLDDDGVWATADCDDTDSLLGSILLDADCDGALTDADCDDDDETSTIKADDADCDSVLTDADCDDTDSLLGSILLDADCDGVLTADDCDDDPTDDDNISDDIETISDYGAIVDDLDCDGLTNDVDDDADGDGVNAFEEDDVTPLDCDDTDSLLGSILLDADCDSVLSTDDIDDTSSTSDSDTDGQTDIDEFICESDPLDNTSIYDTTDSDNNGTADCLE